MPSSPPREQSQNPESMHTSTSSTSSLIRGRSKTTYFHGGIGGAGNYHEVVRDSGADRGPYPHTAPRRSQLSRSITALFSGGAGGAGNLQSGSDASTLREDEELARARARTSQYPSRCDMSLSSTSELSTQPLPLGAADVIKRKLLGEKSAKSTNDHRN